MDTRHNKQVVARFDELASTGGDPAELDAPCSPDMINHARAPGRPPGLKGTRQFLRTARRDVHAGRWANSYVVAEDDLVVQFGSRELTWPGGPLFGFDTPAGTATRNVAFVYRREHGCIARGGPSARTVDAHSAWWLAPLDAILKRALLSSVFGAVILAVAINLLAGL